MSNDLSGLANLVLRVTGAKDVNEIVTALANAREGIQQTAREARLLDNVEKTLVRMGKSSTQAAVGMRRFAEASKAVQSTPQMQGLSTSLKLMRQQEQAEIQRTKVVQAEAQKQQRAREVAARAAERSSAQQIRAAEKAAVTQTRVAAQAEKAALAQSMAEERSGRNSAITARYALYDVATTWGLLSTAILGAGLAVTKTSIDFETALAQVNRTTGLTEDAFDRLETGLLDLSTNLATTFTDTAGIAALAGQLGVAQASLEDFTETSAKFSATTDATTEASATALARLSQMTDAFAKDGSESYNRLGSAILKTGVNSIATESQIISVGNEIATSADKAGFTADQIVGLSSALASLQIPAERARGTIQRSFDTIEMAVAGGGERLEQLAAISEMSAEQFAAQWESAPAQAFQQFLSGLNKAANVKDTLASVGIAASRDTDTLARLANNMNVVNRAFTDAEQGYRSGTELADQYGVIAETTAAKIQMLVNTVQSLIYTLAQSGSLPVLGTMLDGLQGLADLFYEFSKNPVGKIFFGVTGAIVLAVGALAAYQSMVAMTRASFLAMIIAQRELAQASAYSSTTFGEMRLMLKSLVFGTKELTAANAGLIVSNKAVAASSGAVAASSGKAASGFAGFAANLKGIGWMAVASAAIWGLTKILGAVSESFQTSGQKAEEFLGDLSGLSEALAKDSAAGYDGEVFSTFTSEVTKSQSAVSESQAELNDWASGMGTAADAQERLASSTATTTDEVSNQIIKIGENTKAWLATSIATSPKFQESWRQNGAAVQAAGFELQGYLDAIAADPGFGGTQYLNSLIDSVQEDLDAFGQLSDLTAEDLVDQKALLAQRNALLALSEATVGFDAASQEAAIQIGITNGLLGDTSGLEDSAEGASTLGQKLSEIVDLYSENTFGILQMQNSLYDLGNALATNGSSFDVYSASGRANLGSLQQVLSSMVTNAAGDSSLLATNLAGLIQALSSYGVDAVGQLGWVQNILAGLLGSGAILGDVATAATTAGDALGGGFSSGAQNAASSAKSAQKEVRTLTDYVRDLQQVFSNSFDMRFGLEQAIDDTANSWADLSDWADDAAAAIESAREDVDGAKDSIRDAKTAIADLKAEILGLRSQGDILRYQLKVAVEYGDSLRAGEIRSELAQNAADISKTQDDQSDSTKDLTKGEKALKTAKEALNRAYTNSVLNLDNNTASSREQREAVLGLIKSYQDQVTALANTGLSESQLAAKVAELKNQFQSQLQQMGYNRVEVSKYSAAFNDLSYAISKVPRKLTISANTDPAVRAVNEYLATINKASSAVDTLNRKTIGGNVSLASSEKYARLLSWQVALAAALAAATDNTKSSDTRLRAGQGAAQIRQMIQSGNYWGGGFTGRGGKYDWAGNVHKGEFVFPQELVNQRTGLPYANALSAMVPSTSTTNNYYSGGHVSGKGPQVQLVELLPAQLAQLAASVSTVLALDGKTLTSAINGVNNRQFALGRG